MNDGVARNVTVGIDPTPQPDRIGLDVPADCRIVIPEIIVVLASLHVVILARESEVERTLNASRRNRARLSAHLGP